MEVGVRDGLARKRLGSAVWLVGGVFFAHGLLFLRTMGWCDMQDGVLSVVAELVI